MRWLDPVEESMMRDCCGSELGPAVEYDSAEGLALDRLHARGLVFTRPGEGGCIEYWATDLGRAITVALAAQRVEVST